MLSLVLFISLLAGFAAAQNSTKLDPNSVPLSQRNQWCRGETDNCPKLCGGPTFIKDNYCYGDSLNFACTCTNGTGPTNIADYLDTLPNYICQETFKQCNINTPGSSDCKDCGKLAVSSVPSSTPSSTAAATSSATAAATESPSASSTSAAMGKVEHIEFAMWTWAVMTGGVLFGALLL